MKPGLTIYKSSAGSGKTYTLVKEYLKIVLQNPSAYRHTLAITFTNKATAEMKNRIVEALVSLFEDSDESLKTLLEKEINRPGLVIKERAGKVLELILHDYSSFSISTIDSFFSGIIRSLAKEMQLPLQYEVEMNQEFISTRLAQMLLADAGHDEALTEWLEEFVLTKMEDEKGWNIEHEIAQIAKEIFKERQQVSVMAESCLDLALLRTLKSIRSGFEKTMKEFGENFARILESEGLQVPDFAHGKNGVANYFMKIRKPLQPKEFIPGSRVMEALHAPEKWTTKTSALRNQIILLAENSLIPLARKTDSFYNDHFKDYASACVVLSMAYLAGLVNHLKEKMKQYRDENNILLISDTNALIRQYISDHDTPFIYEKTGNKFSHYLIDEFQDTSDLQWQNLLPLVMNSLGTGGFTMMVGDAKQSIYRWRGGNMKLMLENIPRDLRSFYDLKNVLHLETNYRSLKEIVDFNNAFFSLAPGLLPVSDRQLTDMAYHPDDTFQKNEEKKSSGGFVSITLIPEKIKTEGEQDISWKKTALSIMVDTIKSALQKGYSHNEVAILIRTNKEGREIAAHLFASGYLKISSADSLMIQNAPPVVFLINVITALAYPDHKPAMAEVIYYYQRYILKNENADLHLYFTDPGIHLNSRSSLLPVQWYEEQDILASSSIYELTEKLISIFTLDREPDAFIQRFQDLLLEYSGKNQESLKDFLGWWHDHKDSEKFSVVIPGDRDALNIVSIHRSKGLQYPVVILPFNDWKLKPKPDNLLWVTSETKPFNQLGLFPVKTTELLSQTWFADDYHRELDQQYLDNLNLLYVAFTRAEEKLYLCAPDLMETENGIGSVAQLLNAVIEREGTWNTLIKENMGNRVLTFGKDHVKTGSGKPEKVSDGSFNAPAGRTLSTYQSNDWHQRLHIKAAKNFLPSGTGEQIRPAIDTGLLLHETMALIKHRTDADQAVKYISGKYLLDEKETILLKKDLEQLFILCEGEKWFEESRHIYNEREIILPDGTLLRPDRVMLSAEEVIVVDYKTGARESSHLQQVKNYTSVIMGMGHKKVNGFLVYLKENVLVRVE